MSKVSSILSAFHALAIAITLASCEKVAIPESDASEELNGNLHVSVYQIEQTPFAGSTRTTEAASVACTRLNFAIYDEGGSRLKQINQTSDNTGFGQCAFQLDEGTYQLVVVGHSANGNPTMTNLTKIQFTNTTGYTDTFLCYGEVTIGEEQVEYEVSLDRIVALCRFVVTDDMFDALVHLADEKGIVGTEEQRQVARRETNTLLKAYIARNLFDDEGFYPIYAPMDEVLQRAIEELKRE